jgi:hypothetical protein
MKILQFTLLYIFICDKNHYCFDTSKQKRISNLINCNISIISDNYSNKVLVFLKTQNLNYIFNLFDY